MGKYEVTYLIEGRAKEWGPKGARAWLPKDPRSRSYSQPHQEAAVGIEESSLTLPFLHHSAWHSESQENVWLGHPPAGKVSPIIFFPSYMTATEKRIPKGFGMLLPRKRRKNGKCTKPISNLGPLAGNKEGSKIWRKKYIFMYSKFISSMSVNLWWLLIQPFKENLPLWYNLPFLNKWWVWREFQLIMVLSVTELALVRFGYHVSFTGRES